MSSIMGNISDDEAERIIRLLVAALYYQPRRVEDVALPEDLTDSEEDDSL